MVDTIKQDTSNAHHLCMYTVLSTHVRGPSYNKMVA